MVGDDVRRNEQPEIEQYRSDSLSVDLEAMVYKGDERDPKRVLSVYISQ